VLRAGLFLLFALAGEDSGRAGKQILVDESQIERLAEQFRRTWTRPPTRLELQGQAEELV
jgi:hypothetical protein